MADEREDRTMKNTEIGMIPDDWEVKKLGELGSFSKGTSISKEESNSGNIPAIRYGELYTHHNNYIKSFYSHISSEVAKKAKQLKKGDLLFTCSGETKEDIGKCVAFISDKEAYAGSDLIILSPNIKIDSTYCGFLLNTDFCVKQKSSYGQGDAVVHISAESIKKVKIPLPPTLAEQQEIAKALSDVDNVISTLEKLITKKKNLKQGTMQQLLTGKKRLLGFAKSNKFKQTEIGEIPEDWEVKEFCKVATLYNGRAYSQEELLDHGKYKVLRVGNFGTNDIWYFSNLELPTNQYCNKGDLLYCWSCTYGAYIWNEDTTIYHYHIWKIIEKEDADKNYLKYILNNDIEEQMNKSNGSTMAHITKGFLEKRKFIFPSKPEQTAIANVLSSMDKEIEALEAKLGKYRNLKTGMMQQLLTGKIRLR